MAGITLHNITKTFGSNTVLNGVDLDIKDGEFLTLVGPSGCGKSTLLRIIAGLEEQTGGDVVIDGKNVNDVRPCHRDLSMVFQSYALYPHLTVGENIATPLKLRNLNAFERIPLLGRLAAGRKAKTAAIKQAVADVASTLQLEHLLDRKPGQLSGGQRQRVALGRAMVRKPLAFLMDEPLSNLDAALRVHMRAELAELHRSLATTFIYVTHDQAEALTMSDRVAVMMGGDIIQLGTPSEIYTNPLDSRVAQFIGSPAVNMLPARLVGSGALSILGEGTGLHVENADAAQNIEAGIRPEHFELVAGDTAKPCWTLHVAHKENLGADYFLHGALAGAKGDADAGETTRCIVRATPEQALGCAVGDAVAVTVATEHVLAFGADKKRVAVQVREGSYVRAA